MAGTPEDPPQSPTRPEPAQDDREGWRTVPPGWEPRRPAWAGEPEGTTRVSGPLPYGRIVAGIALAAAGLLWLLASLDVVTLSAQLVLAGGLVLVGLGLVVASPSGATRRQWGLIWLGIVLAAILSLGTALNVELRGGVGDRSERPTVASDLSSGFHLAVGQLQVDLSDVPLARGHNRVETSVGLGQLRLRVPAGVAVRVHAMSGVGQVRLFGQDFSGFVVDRTVTRGDFDRAARRLEVDASVGMGQVEIAETTGAETSD